VLGVGRGVRVGFGVGFGVADGFGVAVGVGLGGVDAVGSADPVSLGEAERLLVGATEPPGDEDAPLGAVEAEEVGAGVRGIVGTGVGPPIAPAMGSGGPLPPRT
jgi:hypothetical protein